MQTVIDGIDFKLLFTKLLMFALAFTAGFALIELYVPLKRFFAGIEQDWVLVWTEVNLKLYLALIIPLSFLYCYSSYKKELGKK